MIPNLRMILKDVWRDWWNDMLPKCVTSCIVSIANCTLEILQVDALSELFVAWDNTLLEMASRTNRLEKEAWERQRLGLEPQLL